MQKLKSKCRKDVSSSSGLSSSFSGGEHALCSAALVMNYNDSGSHKNVPHPAPTPPPLTPADRGVYYCLVTSLQTWCVLVLRGPHFPFRIRSSPTQLDASWRSPLKALKSPLCTQISFQVRVPSPPYEL